MADDSLFEDKPFGTEAQNNDDDLFEDVPHGTELSAAPAAEPEPTLSRPEAAAVSLGQGVGMGLTPILSGIAGAGINAVEQAGDALGLTTDAQLEAQGFTQPDKKSGLEGLMQAYYESRDAQKKAQEQAHEQYPVQSIGLNIAGAIPSTVATGGATGVLSKALPGIQKSGTIAKGVIEGTAAGGLSGFGEGDARLLEGELPQAIEETAESAIGGGIIGGAIPVLGKTAGFVAKKVPGAKSAITGFKLGEAGIDASPEGVGSAVKGYSEDLLNSIRTKFRQAGLTKANALDYADEVGVRVNAGENFDDVMSDIVERGASSVEDQSEKLKLFKSLKSLKDGPANKAQERLDVAGAKNVQKMGQKGFSFSGQEQSSIPVSDIIPESQSTKNILGAEQQFSKQIVDQSGNPITQEVSKLVQQAEDVLPINIKQYDLNNLSLRDLEQVIGEINRHTGDLTGPARTESERIARQLAGQLRTMSQDALEMGGAKGNTQLSNIFSAARKAGIDEGDILTKNTERTNEMVDQLRKMTTSGDRIKAERFFEYMKKVDPNFSKAENVGQFLNEATNLTKNIDKSVQSAGWEGLKGSIPSAVVKGSNVAGKAVNQFNKLTTAAPEKLSELAQRFGAPGMSKAAQSYVSPLMKASQSDQRTRTAILYGLYQQPAFRELYGTIGETANETMKSAIPGVKSEEE